MNVIKDMKKLSLQPTLEFIEKNINMGIEKHAYYLSRNSEITPEFIEKHLDWKWNVYFLSENSNLTPEFIEKHLDWNWDAIALSKNPNITEEFVEKHSDWGWSMDWLCTNPNISISFLISFCRKNRSTNFILIFIYFIIFTLIKLEQKFYHYL